MTGYNTVFNFQDFLQVVILLFPVSFEPVFTCIFPVTVNEYTAVDPLEQRSICSVNNDHLERLKVDFFRSDPVFSKYYQWLYYIRFSFRCFPNIFIQHIQPDLAGTDLANINLAHPFIGSGRIDEVVVLLDDTRRDALIRKKVFEGIGYFGFACPRFTADRKKEYTGFGFGIDEVIDDAIDNGNPIDIN